MNTLQLVPELKSGGVETGVVDLTKELVKKGHKAVVISAGGALVDEIAKSGGVHYKLPVDKKNVVGVIKMINRIRQIIRREDIDVVHARSRVPAISSFFACYREKVPFVSTCHGYYSKHIFSRVMGWGKLVIVSSQIIAKHMIEDFGVPRQRIRLIPRGVDLDKFKYSAPNMKKEKKEFTIAVVGRITPLKGHTYFIHAISKTIKAVPNIKALIIGEAPAQKKKYETELKSLVNKLSLAKYVDFLGRRDDIAQLLHSVDVLVLPTVTPEAFGRVIIEAQASGVCVIATKIGGVVDIIADEKNGLLVPPRDWNSMADAIIRILKNPEFAARLAKQARSNVERNFSLQKMYKNTISVYEEAKNHIKILVIKISAIGDVILSIPSLEAIRRHFPKAKITALVGAPSREVISNCPYIDELIVFGNTDKHKSRFKKVMEVAGDLRREYFDIVIDLQNNRISHLLSFLSMSPRRIGYKSRKLDFLLTDKIDGIKLKMPPLEHQFRLLNSIGIKQVPKKLQLFPTEAERQNIDKMLDNEWVSEKQILIGMNIGASARWRTKRWAMENFIKLCQKFSQKDIRVVITGSKGDMPLAERLVSSVKSKPINLVGKTTLMELACLIKRCKLFITGDSAPLHIACAMSTPCIALFGPTDPARHLQPSESVAVIQKDLRCVPCYRRFCPHTKCMERISVEEVFEVAMNILGMK